MKQLVALATVPGFALGSLALAVPAASAATTTAKPTHKVSLTCKTGYSVKQVKVHGKMVSECLKNPLSPPKAQGT